MSDMKKQNVNEEKEERVEETLTGSEAQTDIVNKTTDSKKPPKKKISKLLCVGIIALFAVISFIVGIIAADVPISDLFSKTKNFSAAEMNIVLPKDFTPITGRDDLIACYGTNDVSVYIQKEPITEDSELKLYDLNNYRFNLLHKNGLTYADLKNTEGNAYFVYDYVNEASNVTYTFYTFTYQSDNAFWIVQFATEKVNASKFEADIIQWADTVTFAEQTENK